MSKGVKPSQRPQVREKVNTHKQHNNNNNNNNNNNKSPAAQLMHSANDSIAIKDISAILQAVPDAQMSLLQAAVSNVQNNSQIQNTTQAVQNPSVEDTINSILSAPVAVGDDKGVGGVEAGLTGLGVTGGLQGADGASSLENAAIVLSNEQLAELMSGKSVEEVLQAQNNALAGGVQQQQVFVGNSLDVLQGATSNDPEIPPLREIHMGQSGTAPLSNNFLQQQNKPKTYIPSQAHLPSAKKETFNKPNVLQRTKSKSTFTYDNRNNNSSNSNSNSSYQLA